MKIREITAGAVLTAAALTIFIIENQIPVPVPIYGFRLGLSNIITLITLVLWTRQGSLSVLLMRIVLSSVICASGIAILYSLAGGLFSFFIMSVLCSVTGKRNIPLIGICGAVCHNAAQLCTAAVILKSTSVFIYFPVLVSVGITAGLFTGLAAMYCVRNKYISSLFNTMRN